MYHFAIIGNINSNPLGAVYMRHWIGTALIQIMACRLFGAKPLSKPILGDCHLDSWDKIQWNFNPNSCIFIQENAFENVVCETAAICPGGDELSESIKYMWSTDQ